MHNLQAVTHEWYHCPRPTRRSYFWPSTWFALSCLEAAHVISTANHKRHHRHSMASPDDAEQWFDIYMPGCCERAAQRYYSCLLPLRRSGSRGRGMQDAATATAMAVVAVAVPLHLASLRWWLLAR